MAQTITFEMSKDEAAQLSAVIEQCLITVREANERIDQIESERLKLQAETRATLNQLKAMFYVEATL
jgi:hypothetical protein